MSFIFDTTSGQGRDVKPLKSPVAGPLMDGSGRRGVVIEREVILTES